MLNQIITLAKEVGQFIRTEAQNFDRNAIEMKEFNNLVSYVDRGAEERLVAGLRETLPEAGFIAEEGTASASNEEYRWVVDPLDGTTNFSHAIPAFAISIALAKGEELLLGVVYEVNRDECFYAEKGKGAFLNGKAISVTKSTALKDTLVATGFPYYMFDKVDDYLAILKEFMQNTRGVRRIGSAAVDLCYTACGRFDSYYEFNLNPYDVCGGAIIVQEAGGMVTDFSGGNNFFSGAEIVASAPGVHEQVLEKIQAHWK